MNDASRPTGNGPTALGHTVVVAADRGGDFTAIDAAVAAADAQTRIVVRPGIYRETVVLDRAVEIVGDGPGGAIVLAGQNAPALWSIATGAVVRGLTLRLEVASGGGLGGFFKRLISSGTTSRAGQPRTDVAVAVTSGDVLLEGCVVDSSFDSAIVIEGGASAPTLRRLDVSGAARAGIAILDGASPRIEECVIHHNGGPAIAITGQGTNPAVVRNKLADDVPGPER